MAEFCPGDRVTLIEMDWMAGEVRLPATVVATDPAGRVRVRVEAGTQRHDWTVDAGALEPATLSPEAAQ